MKIYIYKSVSPISTNWHDGGAVTIITDREPQEAWKAHWQGVIDDDSDSKYYAEQYLAIQKAELGEPDFVYGTDATEEQVLIFEDAGCC